MIQRNQITLLIVIVCMLSNLLASFYVITLQSLYNTQREAATKQASKERNAVFCILKVEPEARTDAIIKSCKDDPGL